MGLAGLVAIEAGEHESALDLLSRSARLGIEANGPSSDGARLSWPDAVASAIALDQEPEAQALIGLLADQPPGLVPPLLRAELAHSRGLLAARTGHEDAEPHLRAAAARLADLDYPYWLSRAQLDLGAWLTERERADEASPLLAAGERVMLKLGVPLPVRPRYAAIEGLRL